MANNSDGIKINKRFLRASKEGDLEECRRLIAQGANINYDDGYEIALHGAVQKDHLEIVRFLLKMGADPRCKEPYSGMDAIELAAFRSSDQKIMDLLLEQAAGLRSVTELDELRGCRHLVEGRLDSAYVCLFGKDIAPYPANIDASFITELVIKAFGVLARYKASSLFWYHWIYQLNRQDGRMYDCIKLIKFIIRETKLSYELIYESVKQFTTIDLTGACEIVECINSVLRNKDLDPDLEREMEYLKYAVSRMVWNLIHESSEMKQQENQSDDLIIRFAEGIKKFPLKNELFLCHDQLLKYPFLGKLRFLIELCEVDPNSPTYYGCSALQQLLGTRRLLGTRHKRDYVISAKHLKEFEEGAKILLENGLHCCRVCRDTELVKKLVERLRLDYVIPKIPRLECLAASKISKRNIDTSTLPKRLQQFVKRHGHYTRKSGCIFIM